jgi:hypothetical protein
MLKSYSPKELLLNNMQQSKIFMKEMIGGDAIQGKPNQNEKAWKTYRPIQFS